MSPDKFLKEHISPLIAWAVIVFAIIIFGLVAYLSFSQTSKDLTSAREAEDKAPKSAPFIPRSYKVNGESWQVIKTDEYHLPAWGLSIRIPFQYPKTIATTYVESEDSYYFADIATLSSSNCFERFYRQVRATRPGLKVQKINGFSSTVRVGTASQSINDYYAKNQVKDTNYTVLPGDQGSLRKAYRVGEYFYYDLSELPTEKLDETMQNQRALFCKDAKILEADEVFISSISTLKQD